MVSDGLYTKPKKNRNKVYTEKDTLDEKHAGKAGMGKSASNGFDPETGKLDRLDLHIKMNESQMQNSGKGFTTFEEENEGYVANVDGFS